MKELILTADADLFTLIENVNKVINDPNNTDFSKVQISEVDKLYFVTYIHTSNANTKLSTLNSTGG